MKTRREGRSGYLAVVLVAMIVLAAVGAVSAIYFLNIPRVTSTMTGPQSTSEGTTVSPTVSTVGSTTPDTTHLGTTTTTLILTTSSQSGAQCPLQGPSNSSENVPNTPAGPVTPVFGLGLAPPANTITIPSDTMVWDTWTLSSSTLVCGAQTSFLPAGSASSPVFALYVDGKLAAQDSTHVPAGTAQSGANWNVWSSTPLFVNQTFAAGSTMTLAIFSSTPVAVFVTHQGQTFESTSSALPTELPAANSTESYSVGMYGAVW